MNGPWSGIAGAWVGHAAAWQPIVTTVAVGVVGLSSDVRPASADVASWAVSARARLAARAHAAAHSVVIGTAARLGIVCRPYPAGALASTEAMAEAVALSLVLRQCSAGTGVREVLRLC